MSDIVAPAYRAIIISSSGEYIEMGQFLSLQFGYSLNKSTTATLSLSLDDPKLNDQTKAVLQSWIRIERRDDPTDSSSAYRLVWYGKMYNAQYSGDQNSGTITLTYIDLAGLLETRWTAKGYQILTATDQGDILWDIINDTQSETYGDLGITRGAHPTSHNRTAGKDLQSRSILDILSSYSEINYGIDWEITPTPYTSEIGIFNIYYKGDSYQYHKGEELSTVLRYTKGTDNSAIYNNNVISFSIEERGDDFSNRVAVYGAATEETQKSGTSEDTVSQSNYGLFERHVSEPDVSSQSVLDDKSASYLNEMVQIPKNISIALRPLTYPRFGDFDVGDIFHFDFNYGNAVAFNAQYRLYEMTVVVDNDGVEKMNLTLNVV